MTQTQLIIAEFEARKRGDVEEAARLQALRWTQTMGAIVNSESTRRPSRPK